MRDRWNWPEENRRVWEPAKGPWLAFYEACREKPEDWPKDPRKQTDPVIMQFDVDNAPPKLALMAGRLYVRSCYPVILERVKKIRQYLPATGVILTGQPGIGASLYIHRSQQT